MQRQAPLQLHRHLPSARERVREYPCQGAIRLHRSSCRRVRHESTGQDDIREPSLRPREDGMDPPHVSFYPSLLCCSNPYRMPGKAGAYEARTGRNKFRQCRITPNILCHSNPRVEIGATGGGRPNHKVIYAHNGKPANPNTPSPKIEGSAVQGQPRLNKPVTHPSDLAS